MFVAGALHVANCDFRWVKNIVDNVLVGGHLEVYTEDIMTFVSVIYQIYKCTLRMYIDT